MRVFLLIVFFNLCLSFYSAAQLQKGTILLESSFGFLMEELDGDGDASWITAQNRTESRFNSSIKVGYLLNDKMIIGSKLAYRIERVKDRNLPAAGLSPTTGFTTSTAQFDFDNREITSFLGIYVGRLFHLTKQLQLLPRFTLGYENTTYKNAPISGIGNTTNNVSEQAALVYKSKFLNAELSSTLLYQIKKRWALQASFFSGSLRFNFDHPDPTSIRPKTNLETAIAVAPSTWEFGLVLFL